MPFSVPPPGTITTSDISDWASATASFLTGIPGTLTGEVLASPTITGTASNAGTITGGTVAPAAAIIGNAGSKITVSQTADVGGFQAVAIVASGTNTNVPLILSPAGSGYLAAARPDGTTAGGNERGNFAGDWQQSRGTAAQGATGAYSTLAGGRNNTASGQYAVAAGYNNTASGQGGVALGQGANDNGLYGSLAFSAGYTGQLTIGQLGGISGSGTPVRLTADGNAASAANILNLGNNQVLAGTLTITVRNVSNGEGALWSIPLLYRNPAGTVTVVNPGAAAIAPTATDSSLSGATVTVAADTTNKGLNITVTPPASTTVHASAVFIGSQIS
jgi:hypothetical protein